MDLILSSYYIPTLVVNDISKLTLADLTLSNDESDLIKKLSIFTKIPTNDALIGVGATSSQGFVKYNRPNPFAL